MTPVFFEIDPLLTALSAFLLIAGTVALYRGQANENPMNFLRGLGLFALVGFVISLCVGLVVAHENAMENAAAQIRATYGIELTTREVEELGYPLSEPKTEFKVLGDNGDYRLTADGIERAETMILIWRSGELQLASSSDSETFEELERK